MLTSQLTGFAPLKSDSPLLYTWRVTNDDRSRVRLRNGSGGFLLAHLARRFDKRVEDIDWNYRNGALDDWGHAFRPVRGYSQLSRHAYGLAEDLNATEHPLGTDARDNFTRDQVDFIREVLLEPYDGCIRWGGDYSGRTDPMHFEIDRPLADCERVARRLIVKTPAGRWLDKHNPGQRRVIFS
jgi:hypothetical protein